MAPLCTCIPSSVFKEHGELVPMSLVEVLLLLMAMGEHGLVFVNDTVKSKSWLNAKDDGGLQCTILQSVASLEI
jgi:hypothetical protein